MTPLELWGGIECTVNRVGDRFFDQLARSGHIGRSDDITRCAALGIRSIRYPVLWEHVAPERPGQWDWRWPDDRLGRIRDAGLKPIVGLLHHGSGPRYTSLIADDFPERFAEYAAAVACRYPWVTDWTPVNEPLTTARFSGLYGVWYPHGRDDRTFIRALLNQLRATALAMREIRAIVPGARLIQTEDLGRVSGTPALRRQVEHECQRRWLTWDILEGRLTPDHPWYRRLRRFGAGDDELAAFVEQPCPPDVLGINYYLTSDRWLDDRVELYPPHTRGGNGRQVYADVEAARARPRGIAGHERQLLQAWTRYRRPLALTEVHLGGTRDDQMRWIVEAWRACERARARGADVRALTLWALFGSFDWDSLVTREGGHYEPGVFDVRGSAPRRTALAAVAAELSQGLQPDHPVLSAQGWWRRRGRLTCGPVASPVFDHRLSGPPIVVIGRGTLAQGLARVAADRGVLVHLIGRPELDLCDPSRLDAALRRLKPWAVINAAGYVRVDAAESDRDGCWRDNVTAAVNAAAACRRRRLPLVTFSSDLVFDGRSTAPYVEGDEPAPLNVYGASKAEAERRVLELLPDALVIRTSAFFGPWDAANFATGAVTTLRDGRVFHAADDYVVSPTYVPDLAHAVLDLLIDGERGTWHLANDGALTWCDFARAVADEAGLDDTLVVGRRCNDLWQPAARPPYSVLGSVKGGLLRPLPLAIRAFVSELGAAESREIGRRLSS